MHELLQAIEIALQFTPGSQMPGLEGVLFRFADPGLHVYASNGHTMARLTLKDIGESVTGEYFIGTEDLTGAVERLSAHGSAPVSISAWDKSLMLMVHDVVETFRQTDCGYNGRHLQFFDEPPQQHSMKMDIDLVYRCAMNCGQVLSGFSKHGPCVTFRHTGTMMVISPMLVKDLKHLTAIDIVIAQLEL